MGRNISIYLNDEMLGLVESTGEPASKVVQNALKNYFISENKADSFQKVHDCAQALGKSDRFKEIISDWEYERGQDRW